jgi:hypothetical protein
MLPFSRTTLGTIFIGHATLSPISFILKIDIGISIPSPIFGVVHSIGINVELAPNLSISKKLVLIIGAACTFVSNRELRAVIPPTASASLIETSSIFLSGNIFCFYTGVVIFLDTHLRNIFFYV